MPECGWSIPLWPPLSKSSTLIVLRSVVPVQTRYQGHNALSLHTLDFVVFTELDVLPLLIIHIPFLHLFIVLDQNILIIVNQITIVVNSLPLDNTITLELCNPLRVEHVAGGLERCAAFLRVDFLDERWEEEDHVAAFVHNRGATEPAGDFARKVVSGVFVRRVIPAQVVDALSEVDIGLVEDRCPLEWCLPGGTLSVSVQR